MLFIRESKIYFSNIFQLNPVCYLKLYDHSGLFLLISASQPNRGFFYANLFSYSQSNG